MMAIDFPSSPAVGQRYVFAGVSYTFTSQGVWTANSGQSDFIASATAPLGPKPGDHWYDLTTGILAVWIDDGNSAQWVQVAISAGISAAPLDAAAYNGIQINGSMEISQENGAAPVSTALKYVVDGYMIDFTGGVSAATGVQVVDGPPGFVNSIKISVGTSSGAETTVRFLKRIEGYRFSRLAFGTANAQPLTIGFWSKIHRPGLYSVGLRNGNNTRCCAMGFTQNVADTWEYKTVTFPGDTTGTWVTNDALGASVSFCMSVGSAAHITPGVWTAGAAVGVPGMINTLAVTDTFQITGVVLIPGSQAPAAAQSSLIMRPFDQELLTCQRYLTRFGSGGTVPFESFGGGAVFTPTEFYGLMHHATQMRVVPTVTTSAPGTFIASIGGGSLAITAIAAIVVSRKTSQFSLTSSGLPVGAAGFLQANGSAVAFIQMDSRM